MSSAASFTVAVLAGPRFGQVTIQNGQVVLNWATVAGHAYRVEVKQDIDQPDWIPLSDMVATGDILGIALPATAEHRFYRVVLTR